MPDSIWSLPLHDLERTLALLPSVTTWSRLEPLSLSPDLQPGLQALVADPLWLLARQWQFDELRGEDGGSPVGAVVNLEHAPVGRLHPGALGPRPDQRAVDVADDQVPLEARVEAEDVRRPADRVRAEAGLQLLRLLAQANLQQIRDRVISRWAFTAAPPDDQDPAGTARAAVYVGRIPDADRVQADLAPLAGPDGALTALPAGLTVPGGANGAKRARNALAAWLRWYRGYLAGPSGAPSWNPYRQEYSFAVQAELPSGRAVLRSDEYATGRLDWSDFDAATRPNLGATPAGRTGGRIRKVLIPTPARFPGMPSDRYWAFEDAQVYLGGVEAGPTDLTRLALVEFALSFGVDWFVLPIDVPTGSVVRTGELAVRDTFGFTVSVPPARQPGQFALFGLTPTTDSSVASEFFFVPPVVPHVLQSDPLEEVALFRDEMANLVWGVERVVQGPSGEPVHRARLAAPISLRQTIPGDLADATIVYRLMSPVSEYWVPFVAVPAQGAPRNSGAIELERRPLLRLREDGTTDLTHPRGVLLRTTPEADVILDRLRLAEEEVPRDGAVVTRRYELTRTLDGGTVLWIGRRKRTGEGEGWSGIRFDTALPPGGA